MLFLSALDLQRALPMDRAMLAAASAFAQLSDAKVTMPLRTHVALGTEGETALMMPAHLHESRAFGVKALTITPQNAHRGAPVINGLLLLFDTESGEPLCVLDANYLTALRTGAASGVATRLMARKNATSLALLGAGAQAICQVLAVCVARPIQRIAIYAPTRDHAETVATRLRGLGPPVPQDIRVADSAREAIGEATIICAATSSSVPVIEDSDLCPGAHINGIGSYTRHMQEVPAETVQRARIVVDQREAAWAEAGDLIIPRAAGLISERNVAGELGEVILGRMPGRTASNEITFFKSVGIAAQDVAAAQAAYERAVRENIGTQVAW